MEIVEVTNERMSLIDGRVDSICTSMDMMRRINAMGIELFKTKIENINNQHRREIEIINLNHQREVELLKRLIPDKEE